MSKCGRHSQTILHDSEAPSTCIREFYKLRLLVVLFGSRFPARSGPLPRPLPKRTLTVPLTPPPRATYTARSGSVDVTSGLGAHAPRLHDVRVLLIVASRFSPVTILMAPEIICLPDGQNFTVTPVFGFFKSNEPSTHPHAYPIGWTEVLNTQERHRPFGDKHLDSSDGVNGHGYAAGGSGDAPVGRHFVLPSVRRVVKTLHTLGSNACLSNIGDTSNSQRLQ